MFFKTFIVFVAAALAKEVIARNVHRHSHQLFHKRADVTKEAIATACIAATAYISETASPAVQIIYEHTHSRFAVKSFEKTALVVSSATPTGAPLTDVVSSSVKAVGGQPTLTATATAPATSSGSSGKRGLAYNDENLLSGFLGIGSKVTWKYNWGQTASTSDGLEFVPMLWGLRSDFTSNWTGHADAALASGSKCLLSFNEPDHRSQANLSVVDAVRGHIQYMNPYASRARISTPAITNSGADGQGISWLTEFISKCEGKCVLDFAAVHWYSPVDAEGFLQHLLDVHSATNLNVWVTEFAPSGTDEQIDEFLKTVMFAMDHNATFSFVERYSYFMVAPASLISSGTSLSGYGSTFAFYE